MANQPFDSTIINPLERPLSSDMNSLQSEAHRDLRDYLYRAYARATSADSLNSTIRTGFVGNGFAVVQNSPPLSDVTITAGLGFGVGTSASNVGGIAGLNDLSLYKPILLSTNKTVTVPTAPGGGLCRRDAIYVRPTMALTDATSSDQYNVSNGQFQSVTLNKTMTFDLVNQAVQTIASGSTDTWTSGIVYAMGADTVYATADDLLNAPIRSAPILSGYIRIAVINSVGTMFAGYTNSYIADWRSILAPNAELTFTGRAEMGGGNSATAPYSDPTISNLYLRAPSGIRAALSHATGIGGAPNNYTFTVIGGGTAYDVEGWFTFKGLAGAIGDTLFSVPAAVMTTGRTLNGYVNAALQTILATSSLASPIVDVAIGQPYQQLNFAVGVNAIDGDGLPHFANNGVTFLSTSSLPDTVEVGFNIKVAV